MTDNWRKQAIPSQNWRSQAVPVTEEVPAKLPVKWVGGKGGAVMLPQEELLNSTSVGRVLDAFGEGASEGWGSEPLGLSDESAQVLKDIGIFSQMGPTLAEPQRAFNEGIIRPLAGGVDAFFRLFPAATKSAAEGLGQVGEELGLLDPNITNMADPRNKQRFTDSLDEFLQIGGIVAGGEATYMGTRINVPKAEKKVKALKEAVEEPPAKKSITDNYGIGERPTLDLPPMLDKPTVKSDVTNQRLNELAYERGKEQLMAPYKDIEESFDAAISATKNMPALHGKLQTIKALFNSANDDPTALYKAFEDAVLAIDFAADNGVKLPDEVFKLQNAMDELTSPLPDMIMRDNRKVVDKEYEFELHQLETEPVLDNIVYRIVHHEEAKKGELPDDFLMSEYQQLAMNDFLAAKGWNKDDLIQRYTSYRDAADKWSEEYGYRSLSDEVLKEVTYQIKKSEGDEIKITLDEDQLIDFTESLGFNLSEDTAITRQVADRLLAERARRGEKKVAPIPPRPEGISPKFVTSAGTIDTAKIGELQDVYGAIEELSQAMEPAPLATRGTVSWAQTEALAQTAGVLPSELLGRGIGEAWNAHQIDSAITLLQQGAKELLEASRKARATGSDADTLAAVEAWNKAALYNEAVTGIKTEAGRALNILKKHKQEAAEVQNISEVLRKLGGNASMDEILEALKKLDNADAGAVNGFVNAVSKVGPTDMVLEYLYNAMLSSPVTHVANMVGNTLAALWEVPVAGLTGAIGAGRAALGSKTALAGDRAFVGEAAARVKGMVQPLLPDLAQIRRGAAEEGIRAKLYGMIQGAPEGLRLAWRAIKEEAPTQGVSKIEYKNKAIPTVAGRAIRVPTTALMAADEVFKAMGYRASLNAQAYRKATKAKLTGDKFKAKVAELQQNPTKQMVEKAHEEADYITFTSELGKTGKAVQRLLAQHPILKVVLAPFFRTPVNLLKHPIRHSPLSLASKETLNVLAGKKGAAARDEAYARMLLGTGVITSAFMAAQMGKLTGAGPKDPAERAMWLLAGNQPYSFRIGDTWYSYARLEPFATLLGVSADAAYISDKLDTDESASIGTLLTYSAGQNVLNKTWLKGVTDIVEAINEPERYGDAYLRNLATRVVPAAVGQAARMDDPYLRDVRSMVDAFKNRYGDSESIYPKRDRFGNAIRREGAWGPDALSPVFITRVNKDPVVQELLNLQIFPGKLEREIRGVELTDQQYDDYQIAAGRLLYQSLGQIINMPGWKSIPSGVRIEIISKQISATAERARTYVMFKHPDILQTSMQQKYNHLTGK